MRENEPQTFQEEALDIAEKAHAGQKDKLGEDYIEHPKRVAAMGKNANERIVGLLHNVVEDSSFSLAEIEASGFPDEVIEALDCLTKREGEAYTDYLARVKENELARVVKLHDIEDNADLSRLSLLDPETRERLIEKYTLANNFLES